MEIYDALSLPLAPALVWEALHNPALVRASLDHCEAVARQPSGEYALALTVPLGPLRARYEVRAHLPAGPPAPMPALRRVVGFRARGDGVGSLRGQIDITLRSAAEPHALTRIDYTVWAAASGPLGTLPARQIENALRHLTDQFFAEFCAVVAAREGLRPNRAAERAPRRHVFLRPATVSGARRARSAPEDAAQGGILRHPQEPAMPAWGWAATIVLVVALLLLYEAGRLAG